MSVGLSKRAKFSTILADADLDIGAQAILTTNLSFYEGSATTFYMRNKAKNANKNLTVGSIIGISSLISNTVSEYNAGYGVATDEVKLKDKQLHQTDALMPQNKDKIASDNLRHSIDAQSEFAQYEDYTQIPNKIFTFTHGIKGVIRVKGLHDAAIGGTVYTRLLKNTAGGSLYDRNFGEAGETWSTDLTVDWGAGTTLNWFGKTSAHNCHWANFRIYYDDGTGFSAVPVAVTGAD